MNIVITESAVNRVAQLLQGRPEESGLRVYIEGGGCSGFRYGFAFENQVDEGDEVIEKNGVKFFIDPLSAQYLDGAEIDFVEELMGSSFQISNPNVSTTCGCGSSFAA